MHSPNQKKETLANAAAFYARKAAAMGRPNADRLATLAATLRDAVDAANEIARYGR